MRLVTEANGKISSSRVMFLLWGAGMFLMWAYVSVKAQSLQPVPETVIAVLAVFAGQKTAQRFGEREE